MLNPKTPKPQNPFIMKYFCILSISWKCIWDNFRHPVSWLCRSSNSTEGITSYSHSCVWSSLECYLLLVFKVSNKYSSNCAIDEKLGCPEDGLHKFNIPQSPNNITEVRFTQRNMSTIWLHSHMSVVISMSNVAMNEGAEKLRDGINSWGELLSLTIWLVLVWLHKELSPKDTDYTLG